MCGFKEGFDATKWKTSQNIFYLCIFSLSLE